MSTRCRIGIVMKTGAITSIYCHNDGYADAPHGVGYTLHKHYQDPDKIRALMALGDISSLGRYVAVPVGKQHSFSSALPGVVVAYGRDRGEADTSATQSADEAAFLAIDSGQEFSYLFDGKWWVWSRYGEPELVRADLAIAVTSARLHA